MPPGNWSDGMTTDQMWSISTPNQLLSLNIHVGGEKKAIKDFVRVVHMATA